MIYLPLHYVTDVQVCECNPRAKQGSAFEGASEKSVPSVTASMDQGSDMMPLGMDSSSSMTRPVVVKRSCTEAMLKVRKMICGVM